MQKLVIKIDVLANLTFALSFIRANLKTRKIIFSGKN